MIPGLIMGKGWGNRSGNQLEMRGRRLGMKRDRCGINAGNGPEMKEVTGKYALKVQGQKGTAGIRETRTGLVRKGMGRGNQR